VLKENPSEMIYSGPLSDYKLLLQWTTDKCIPLVREITFENAEVISPIKPTADQSDVYTVDHGTGLRYSSCTDKFTMSIVMHPALRPQGGYREPPPLPQTILIFHVLEKLYSCHWHIYMFCSCHRYFANINDPEPSLRYF